MLLALDFSIGFVPIGCCRAMLFALEIPIEAIPGGCRYSAPPQAKKKADVAERLSVFDHIGLLVDGPPGLPWVPLI
jgi:hypothetical protein